MQSRSRSRLDFETRSRRDLDFSRRDRSSRRHDDHVAWAPILVYAEGVGALTSEARRERSEPLRSIAPQPIFILGSGRGIFLPLKTSLNLIWSKK